MFDLKIGVGQSNIAFASMLWTLAVTIPLRWPCKPILRRSIFLYDFVDEDFLSFQDVRSFSKFSDVFGLLQIRSEPFD